MENSCCCRRISGIKNSPINYITCNRYLKPYFAFGRFDVTKRLQNTYNILNAKNWCEDINDQFVNCAISNKAIHLFFKVNLLLDPNQQRVYKLMLYELTRDFNNQCSCSTLSQYAIELSQFLCTFEMQLSNPRLLTLDDGSIVTYFTLIKESNDNYWGNILRSVLEKITNSTCRAINSGGGKKSNNIKLIKGKNRIIRKIELGDHRGIYINMVVYKGLLIPVKRLL